jgi:hypothetical protein
MSTGSIALYLDPSDSRYQPKGFGITFKGKFLKFYPGGINPETKLFEPIIMSEGHSNVFLLRAVAGKALIVKMDIGQAIAKMQAKPPAPKPEGGEEEDGEEAHNSPVDGSEPVKRGPGRPRKNV